MTVKNFMKLIITGTPGTGKTTLALALSKSLNFEYLDINTIIDNYNLKQSYDNTRNSFIIDEVKLSNILNKILMKKSNIIIDSHLSHFISKDIIDFCIVTKCSLKMLKKRLITRGYSTKKVRENMDAEIFDICLIESFEAKHNVIVLDTTTQSMNELVAIVKNAISKN
jgi:adenylate kinase